MTHRAPIVVACLAGPLACGSALAHVPYTETFTGGSNSAGWTWGVGGVEPGGGNPGAYLHADFLDTFAPQLRTTNDSNEFVGDLRAAGVQGMGVDVILNYVDFNADERPLSLILGSDNGTPSDFNDDWAAYKLGPNAPLVGDGWKSFFYDVPTDEMSAPADWGYLIFGPDSPPALDWNGLVTNVSQVTFFWGHPEFFFIFQVFDVGADNVFVTDVPAPASIALLSVPMIGALTGRRRR